MDVVTVGLRLDDARLKDLPAEVHEVFGAEAEIVLCTRSCTAQMCSSYDHSFRWPAAGFVEAPDWRPDAVCGGGLHGFAWGEGDGSLATWEDGARWLVFAADAREVVDLGGKVKVPRAVVVFCGELHDAAAYVAACAPGSVAVIGGTAMAGYRGTATAGYRGTATAGIGGTATAGDGGTATAGIRGTATAVINGTATAGDDGTATAGDGGTATAGDGGTATAGYRGTATAGYRGTATAGYRGVLVIRWWDEQAARWRRAVGYVGEDGIEAGKPYRVRDGRLAPASQVAVLEEAGSDG